MGLAAFSETNIANSASELLSARLLEAGYLLYWHAIDAVQTPDDWYYGYVASQSTYAADATFAARLDGARGLMTLKGKTTANPQFPVRPTGDGTVTAQDEVQMPVLALEVGPIITGHSVGLGDTVRERYRHLAIYGLARDVAEQSWLRDQLSAWFDEDFIFDVLNHDDGTRDYVGDARLTLVTADSAINELAPDGSTFEVILNARLVYEA